MRITGTNNQLLMMRKEIQEKSKTSITFALFHKEKIKNFFAYNDIRIREADGKLNRLVKKYVKHDDQGVAVKLSEVNGLAEWDFTDEAAKKDFYNEYAEFINRNITIEF